MNYFEPHEFQCKCGKCEKKTISSELLNILNVIRFMSKMPIIINSGVRCEAHNLTVGGVVNSSHIKGLAVDIRIKNSHERYVILNILFIIGLKRIGVYKDFIHIDIDDSKSQKCVWYG